MLPRKNTRRKLHIPLPDIYPVRFQEQQKKRNGSSQNPWPATGSAPVLEGLMKKMGRSCENKVNAKGLDKTKGKRIVFPLFVLTASTLELCFYHLSLLVKSFPCAARECSLDAPHPVPTPGSHCLLRLPVHHGLATTCNAGRDGFPCAAWETRRPARKPLSA